ncbi:MAG: hypothetical protein EOL86_01345 [Deltaproteobacteria bacterium]|nr:hypothetical protein [Deltaproteobacteria bacterium]
MEISCSHCKTTFILPDDRIPEAKKFKLNCPKCREPIIVDMSETSSESGTMIETFPHDATVAFLFVADAILSQRLKSFFKKNGIYVSDSTEITEAVEKVRINYYNIIVLEDSTNSLPLHEIFKKWNGLRRRDVNIIVVGGNCQSLHGHEAFMRGVNSVISKTDNDEIEKFMELSLGNYQKYIEPWSLAAQRLRAQG